MDRRYFLSVSGSLAASGFTAALSSERVTREDDPQIPWDTTSFAPESHLTHVNAHKAGEFQVHSINVGHGDATLLSTPTNNHILIDTGHSRDEGKYVLEYLQSLGVERIDVLVTTHGHWDHIGGHPQVIDVYETSRNGIGTLIESGPSADTDTYEKYKAAREERDIPIESVSDGDILHWDPTLTTRVINGPECANYDSRNNKSLAFHITYGETSVIITGDTEAYAEQRMLYRYGQQLDADVYVAGHHGGKTSSGQPFLRAVDPMYTLISAFHGPPDGKFPHNETIQRLIDIESRVYWTAVHGTTLLRSNGQTWNVIPQKPASPEPTRIYDQPEVPYPPDAGVYRPFSL